MTSTATALTQEETLVKRCLECGEPIKKGNREDTKYCNDQCRTSYNNRVRREKRQQKQEAATSPAAPEMSTADYVRKIVDILMQNHAILEKIAVGNEPVRMEMRDLMGRGFNFKFFTSEAPTQNGDIYRFCFDRGYKQTPDGFVIIVQRDREVIC